MIASGDRHEEEFSISQEQVHRFAALSGDHNPVHLDAEFAATTPFKKPIVHGIFSASIISKALATSMPGPGTIYVSQELAFKRPVYPDETYKLILEVTAIHPRHNATVITQIFNQAGKLVLDGKAVVMNREEVPAI